MLVIGSPTEEAAQAMAEAGPDCTIVDLTRGAVRAQRRRAAKEQTPWVQAVS